MTAALDAARLGARVPLSADLLRAAAVDCCTSAQQAEAPDNWFEQALAYATEKLHGAAAALSPAAAGMGQVAGYTAADYLIQHATRERRSARVPGSTWDAMLSHVRDPADAARLADSARNRLLYRYAIPLYRHAADVGDENAAWLLAVLLAERGDLDELRARADAGDRDAAGQLAVLLAEAEDLDELRARAGAGDGNAAWQLAGLLRERGDLDGAAQVLRAGADAGDRDAARRLAELLAERGDLDELRARADAGDGDAAWQLAGLLAERGDLDELRARAGAGDGNAAWQLARLLRERGDLAELGTRAGAGDGNAAWQLAGLLRERGDLDGAAQVLRAGADAGDRDAAQLLAGLLAERGDLDELRARAGAGDGNAAWQLARLLRERGDLDELRARAGAGDEHAAWQLAGLLAERGDLDELRARADVGDGNAAGQLADVLVKQGRSGEAERLRRFGLNPDGSIACALTQDYRKQRLSQSSASWAISCQPWSIVREWPRSANSRKSVIAGDLWYSRRVAVTTGGGTVWSLPPAISSSGPRVLLRVSTLAGERGVKFASASSNSGLPGDGTVQRSNSSADSAAGSAFPKP